MSIQDLIQTINTQLPDNDQQLITEGVLRGVLGDMVDTLSSELRVFNINASDVTNNGDGTYTLASVENELMGALAFDEDLNIYQYNGTHWTLKTSGATAAQGALADTAIQPGDNISGLNNDSGYLTETTHDALPQDNPHGVTKAQVGLGNVDNTSDANKPVSTAQQSAINQAEANAKQYTDDEINALNLGSAAQADVGDFATAAQGLKADSAIQPLDNIADLKTVSGDHGSVVRVLGYYTPNDGGGGLFYWDTSSTISDNGGTVIQVTGITTGRWLREQKGYVNVKEFGARGDGVTDDKVAIQTTIDNAGERVVVFPNATYRTSSGITLTDNLTIDGMNSTIKPLPTHGQYAILASQKSNISISDLTVNMNRSQTPDSGTVNNQQAFYFTTGGQVISNINIERVTIIDGRYRGIAMVAQTGGSFENIRVVECIIENMGRDAIFIEGEYNSKNANVEDCIITNCNQGIQLIGFSPAYIHNNVISLGANAINHGIVISSTTLPLDANSSIQISNNYCTGAPDSRWGIVASVNTSRVVISGNICEGNGGGISYDPKDGSNPNALVDAQSIISNNICRNSISSHGIHINTASKLVINGNTCDNNGHSGIAVTNSAKVHVLGNICTNNVQYGVAFFGSLVGSGNHYLGVNVLVDNGINNLSITPDVPGPIISELPANQIGFFGASPVAQQTDPGAITDSTGGTPDGVLAAVSGSGDDININNNFADLAEDLEAIRTALINIGIIG